MKKATREWVRKAESDHKLAKIARRQKPPLHDGVCFHCQQCAEKYLKGLLEELQLTVPKTHELQDILTLLLPHYPKLRAIRSGLITLTRYAVDPRYPGRRTTKQQATAALRRMDIVRSTVRDLLGIPPDRKRRKKVN
jgi:HEPN domain-containing protein